MANHKRATCIILENMSRLVDCPKSLEPFGHLLIPELKKVVENVQFEEIRDVALSALHTLTGALGHASIDDALAMLAFAEDVKLKQEDIEKQRQEEAEAAIKMAAAEAEERRRWKEAM